VAKQVSYWLMKSEPNTYSIDDLKKDKKTIWDGVRNYQARNFMMKEMSLGDKVLFYHSNSKPSGVSGVAKVTREATPDPSALDKKSKYYDSEASKEKPIWFCVEVGFDKKLKRVVSLEEIKNVSALSKMLLVKKGMRLSIQPVEKKEFELICKLAEK